MVNYVLKFKKKKSFSITLYIKIKKQKKIQKLIIVYNFF